MDLFLRRGLVIFQFSLALVFIIGTLLVDHQIRYILRKDLGFEKENVLILPPPLRPEGGYEGFKAELLRNPAISAVTASTGLPGRYPGLPFSFIPEGESASESVPLDFMAVDFDFMSFFGMEMVEGRDFSPSVSADSGRTFILNESAVRKLGWNSALGKRLTEEREGVSGTVVGVVKDFHNVSLHQQIRPAVFHVDSRMFGQVAVRVAPGAAEEALEFLERKWAEWAPFNIFYYSSMDRELEDLYREDRKAGLVFRFASILSVLIACLGLLGLSVFSAETRIKEIGIRKTLGASVPGITALLSRDFVKLVLLANIIAWPIVYYVIRRWLQNFAYFAEPSLWLFALGGAIALLISVATVGFQAVKAALADPVKSLRYE
jgi:putative ABC transport system permease protein